MANYSNLIAGIDAVIKTNGRQEISGAALNTQLKNMVSELGAGYQYKGIATPAANPGTPDANVFYLASEAGTYTNFGGIVINEGEICALVWNGSWTKQVTGAANADKLNQLGQKVTPFYNGYSLVNCSADSRVNAFFKELYIVPQNPNAFNLSAITRIVVSRNYNSGGWEIIFYTENYTTCARFFTQTNPEGVGLITIDEEPEHSYGHRFIGYAVVNWDVLSPGDIVWRQAITISTKTLDISYSPTIGIAKVDTDIRTEINEVELNLSETNNALDSTNKDVEKIADNFNLSTVHADIKLSDLFWENKGIDAEGVVSDWSPGALSGYIPISPKQPIFINSKTTVYCQGVRIALYDNDKVFLSTNTWITNRNTVIWTEENAAFLRVVLYAANSYQLLMANIDDCGVVVNARTTETANTPKNAARDAYPNFVGIPLISHNAVTGSIDGSPLTYAKARALGARWYDVDIQCTFDGHWVCYHDEPINAVRNGLVFKKDYTYNGVTYHKGDVVPGTSVHHFRISQMTLAEIKEYICFADGGEVLTLKENFNYMTSLGMNIRLEFKAAPNSKAALDELVTCCKLFGPERLIYNATTDRTAQFSAERMFPLLKENGIYCMGAASLTTGTKSDIEAYFQLAEALEGKTGVDLWPYGNGFYEDGHYGDENYKIDVSPDSEYIQGLIAQYKVGYAGVWGKSNDTYPNTMVETEYGCDMLPYYANEEYIKQDEDVDYADYTLVKTLEISDPTNVNLIGVADSNIEYYIFDNNKCSGCSCHAWYLNPGTHYLYVKGTGHIVQLLLRY